MTEFLQFTVVGLVAGCIYALAATGLVVTYTTSGIFNFAHGAIGMVAAYTYWQFSVAWGWPAPLAMAVVLLVIAPLFGALVERLLMRPLYGAPVDVTVVVTLALLLGLIGLAFLVWNPQEIRDLPELFPGKDVEIFGFFVNYHQLVVMVTAIVVAVALRFFFVRTRTGIAMRGVVDNPDLVAMAGGRPYRIQMLSWALGASLAALAGILLAPLKNLTVLQLTLLVTFGYAAAMVGRLKSLPMTVLGALILGLGENYAVGYLEAGWLKNVQLIIPMILLFIVLIVLRQGRLRTAGVIGPRAPQPAGLKSSLVWGVIFVIGAWIVSGQLSAVNLLTFSQGMSLAFILLSLVLLTGYGGLTSLCQMTFAGLGAYAMGHWFSDGSALGLLAAFGFAAAWGFALGLPTLRLRGLYLALATLAFAYALDEVFFNQRLGTGGSLDIPRVDIPGVPETDRAYFVVLAFFFAVAGILLLAVRRGRVGRRLAALDDSPAACATLGLNINYTRLAVFTVSAGMAGLGGALYGAVPGQVTPTDWVALLSLLVLLQLRVGGINTITGAFLGAMFFSLFQVLNATQFIQDHPALGNLQYLLTGIAAIAVSRDPNGVGGHIAKVSELARKWWAGRRPGGGIELPTEPPELVPRKELAGV